MYEVECKEAALGEVSQQWLEVTTWSLEVEDAPAGVLVMSSSCCDPSVCVSLGHGAAGARGDLQAEQSGGEAQHRATSRDRP